MRYLYNITIEDYFEAVKRAKENGKKPGDSIEEEFMQIMKEKGQKPLGASELTNDELLKEHSSKGKNILSIEIDKEGKSQYKIAEGRKND